MVSEKRYGNVKAKTMQRDFNALRAAIQKWDAEATEKAWEKCERWLGAILPDVEDRIRRQAIADTMLDALLEDRTND